MYAPTTRLLPLHSRASCAAADDADPLALYRSCFDLPAGLVYLNGNSLGALPREARERARAVTDHDWGVGLVRSWNSAGWAELPERLGQKITRLIADGDGAAVVSDSTSVNLFKALTAAIEVQRSSSPDRRVIVVERDAFPTDRYIAESLVEWLARVGGGSRDLRPLDVRVIDRPEDLSAALDEKVAVVLLSHIDYRSGWMWDLADATAQIHRAGALALWDVSHSVGAVPLHLAADGADFAVGCTYKYLNGGPGAPAFLWSSDAHLARARHPLAGWWSHDAPFRMEEEYRPADGARRFLTGTPPILSLAAVEPGIDLALEADIRELREKSLDLTSLFMRLVDERIPGRPLTLLTPRDPDRRGSHVSYQHPEAFAVIRALSVEGVVGDYREPGVMRFGIAPLYLGYTEIWDAVEALRRVLDTEAWRAPEFSVRTAVT